MKPNDLALKMLYLFRILLQRYAVRRPYHCQFQITRRCNFKCVYCKVWTEEQDPGDELARDGIAVLSKNLRSIGVRSVVLTGGEPLLRKDLADVIGIFKRDRFLVRLQTNGSLLTGNILETVFSRGLNDIYISLDTLKDDVFDQLIGTQSNLLLGRIKGSIANAARLAAKCHAGIFLLTVLQPENSEEVDDLVAFAGDNRCLIGFYGREMGSQRDVNDIRSYDHRLVLTKHEREKMLNAFVRLKSLKRRKRSPIFNSERHIEDYIRFYENGGRDMRWNCNAGESYLTVLPAGRVAVCNAAPWIPGLDYRTVPEFYQRSDRVEDFMRYRASCAGCLCTRQLEHLVHDFSDIIQKTLQYGRLTLLKP